ncbi:hypothetical protein GYB22_10735 [bacterium]|nr:hypothetical protein [bacterium]
MNLPVKSEVLKTLAESLEERKKEVLRQIKTVQESINSDEKSSAGDKYETSRAMGQIEIDQLRTQLSQINNQEAQLSTIYDVKHDTIRNGSLIQLKDKIIFISIAFGKFPVGEDSIIAISAASPIGQALLDHKKGETLTFNGKPIFIIEVY